MTTAAFLLGLALLSVPATAALAQAQSLTAVITATRTSDGCDITLPPSGMKTVVDRMYLVIDGKSEDLVGYDSLNALPQTKPIHYLASASSDTDSQIKDVLTAQGLPIKPDVTTYHVAAGISLPTSNGSDFPAVETLSRTLHFTRASGSAVDVDVSAHKTLYKVGDKIPIFDEVVLDSDITLKDALGPDNIVSSGKFLALPPGQMHWITIQVQFVPKTPGTP